MVMQEKKKPSRADALPIKLTDFPGGAEGFELVARFCYNNGRVPLCPSNLPFLQAEAFVDGLYYWT